MRHSVQSLNIHVYYSCNDFHLCEYATTCTDSKSQTSLKALVDLS